MKVKENWTVDDYKEMSWHDSHVYSLFFPSENLEFSLDIDYLFKWVLNKETNLYSFWVSPCLLTFYDVLNLKVSLDFKDTCGLDIQDIKYAGSRLSPNGKVNILNYEIITDKGVISFDSTGFIQKIKEQPVFIQSQELGRNSGNVSD